MLFKEMKEKQKGNGLLAKSVVIIGAIGLVLSSLSGCSNGWLEHHASRRITPMQEGIITGTVVGLAIDSFANTEFFPLVGVAGGVIGGILGKYIDEHMSLASHLAYYGIKIIQVGDEYRLILPADRFFYDHTARLNRHYEPALGYIAEFLSGFEKTQVEVAGYSDHFGAQWQEEAYTRQQAETLMDNLWKKGVDARVMYARGYGSADPLTADKSNKGRRLNRRIEIRWRIAPI